ncbi:MAG: CpaD family pilus assembly protein [Sphingobium sp.]
MISVPKNILRLGALAVLAMPLAACQEANRGVESIHQPVVSYASYVFDVQSGPSLSAYDTQRLNDWFATLGLGYGDQVAIVTDSGYYNPGLREDVANLVARHGLLLGEDGSAAAGPAPEGAIRLIVRRATASVPGCPDWRSKAETSPDLGTSSNFGCATNSNLAAMIANPEDLVRGQGGDSDLRTATSNRAITTYREKPPTGAGELKQISSGAQ